MLSQKFSHKFCTVCKVSDCLTGKYLKIPENTMRQRWVCQKCIARATSSIVKFNLKINTLNRPEVQAARIGKSCPMSCPHSSTMACLGSPLGQFETKGD
jgi:hypothetical protein